MSDSLYKIIEQIEERARAKDPTALEDAAKLAREYPDEMKVWLSLAYIQGRNRHYDDAVASMSRALEIGPPQPAIFFHRGDYELKRGNLESSLADLTAGIESCHEHEHTHYLQTLYFFRADVLLRLGRRAEARADLAHVREGFQTWTTKLRTKAELLAECDR